MKRTPSVLRSGCASVEKPQKSSKFARIAKRAVQTMLLGAAIFGASWCGMVEKAHAVVPVPIGPFMVNFLENGDTVDGETADATLSAAQRESILDGVRYWANTIDTTGVLAGSIVINVVPDTTISTAASAQVGATTPLVIGDNELIVNPNLNAGDLVRDSQSYRMINKGAASGTGSWGGAVTSDMLIFVSPTNYAVPTSSQVIQKAVGTMNRTLTDMMIHEMGHSLGISSNKNTTAGTFSGILSRWDAHLNDIYGEIASPGMPIAVNGAGTGSDGIFNLYENIPNPELNYIPPNFRGISGGAIEELLGPGNLDGPVLGTNRGILDANALSHTGQMNWRMSYGAFMIMPYFAELELAMLEDMGYDVNRKEAYGRSYYHDFGGVEQNGAAYNQSVLYGVGGHVFTNNLRLRQSLDITSDGMYGTGIRIDGSDNLVTIASGAVIQAGGFGGAALLSSFGSGNVIVSQGDLIANGTNGIGAWFIVGDGMGYDTRSYYDWVPLSNDPRTLYEFAAAREALKGALVDRFDVTGGIVGSAAAISIGDNAHVQEINIMAGAWISGNIETRYRDVDENGVMRGTRLTFGKANVNGVAQATGDGSFAFGYSGNILGGGDIYGDIWGEGAFDMETWGGLTQMAGWNSFRNGDIGLGNTQSEYRLFGQADFQTLIVHGSGVLSGPGIVRTENRLVNRGLISPGVGIGFLDHGGYFKNENGNFLIELNAVYGQVGGPVAGIDNDVFKVVDNPFMTSSREGTARIEGGHVFVDAQSNIFNPTTNPAPARYVGGTEYTFLTTQNGLSVATGGALTSSDFLPVFDFVPYFDSNDYFLRVEREYLYGPYGDTINQIAVGNYIDTISQDPDPGSDFFNVLVNLDALNAGIAHRGGISGAAKYSLDQMSGAIYGTHATSSIMNTTLVNNTLADLLRTDGLSKRRRADCNPCDEVACNPCDQVADCDPCDPCEPICKPKSSKYRRNLWGLGFGLGGATQFDGNAYGYDQSFGGTMVGVDRVRGKSRLGAFLSYGEGYISSDLQERSKSKEVLAGFYFHRKVDGGYFLATGSLGNTRYDTKRTISFMAREARNKHDAFVGTAYAERGLNMKTSFGKLQPFVGLQYVGNQQDSFTEHGAGSLNLKGDRNDADSFRSVLGARLSSKARRVNDGRLSFNGSAVWMHEFLSPTYTDFTAQFSNPNMANFSAVEKFKVRGNDPKRDWAILGLGLNYDKARFRVFAGYDAYVNAQQVLHTGNAGIVVGW